MSKMSEDKEKKRAEALRANLKRRKVAQRGRVDAVKVAQEKKEEQEG